MEKHLVIVASGLATRVHDIHQNLYPKVLMNVGNETILDKILQSAKDYDSYTVVVSDRKSASQISEYLLVSKLRPDVAVSVVVSGKTESSAQTVNAVRHLLPERNVTLHWSDIYVDGNLSEIIDSSEDNYDVLILTDEVSKSHRFSCTEDAGIQPSKTGNVCGIYHFKQLETLFDEFSCERCLDVVEVLAISNAVCKPCKIPNIIVDTGDMPKYENVLAAVAETMSNQTRFFNDLTFTETTVIKRPLTEKGRKLIELEAKWYDAVRESIPQRIAFKMFDPVQVELELNRIVGVTMKTRLQDVTSKVKRLNILASVSDTLQEIHDITSHRTKREVKALLNEYWEVTVDRLKSIESILPEILRVNDVRVSSHSAMLRYLNPAVRDYIRGNSSDFKMIHGDPNMSNVMFDDETGDVVFIDPRGTFGGVELVGDANYDFAKLIYGFTGYDAFNDTVDVRFTYDSATQSIQLNCPVPDFDDICEAVEYLRLPKEVILLIAIIWLKLPAYTINNVNKSIASYAIAKMLLSKYQNKYPN